QLGRHVLHRVHGEVGAPVRHRVLELLHEESLAADFVEAAVEDLIAFRAHRQELDRKAGMEPLQLFSDVLGLPQRESAAARRNDELLHGRSATSSRTVGHWRRLTGSRSVKPSSTTCQCASSSPPPVRSKPRIAARATRQLRWILTNGKGRSVPVNSRSSVISDSSIRCSRTFVRTVTYFCSARRNTMSRTGTSTMRLRSATDRYSRGPPAARARLSRCGAPTLIAFFSAAARRTARKGFNR